MSFFQDEELTLSGRDGAEVIYYEGFLKNSEHTKFLDVINAEVDWGERQVGSMFGKEYIYCLEIPLGLESLIRLIYSGIKNEPMPWTEGLMELKKKVEEFTNCNFNSLLINKYETGKDKVGWHADDEKS